MHGTICDVRSLVAAAIALAGCLSSPPGAGSGDGGTVGPDADTRALLGVEYQPGGQIAASLFEHADGRQGTILLWITLGPDAGDLEGPVELAHLAGFSIELDPAGPDVIARRDGGDLPDEITASIPGWEPDSSHLITLRWDSKTSIAGLQNATLRVDSGDAVPGIDDPFVSELEPDTPQLVRGGLTPADGPIAVRSAFVLRRPIREDDPQGGVNLGIADEHEAIYAAGPDADPTLVFGSWDVVFGLSPHGNPAIREPFLAWSHPHADNLLGAGGFMLLDDATMDDWQLTDLSPTLGGSVGTVTGASGTLGGGYQVANGYISHSLHLGTDVSTGDRLTLRVIAYPIAGTGASANVCVGALGDPCAENLMVGQQTSSRLGPDVMFLTYEVGSQDVEVRLSLTDANGAASRPAVVYSQAELYRNLMVNPGFELAGADALPEGWSASEGLIDSEVTWDEAEWQSGIVSLGITSDSPADEVPDAVLQEPAGMADFELYLVGGFFKRAGSEPAGISVTEGGLYRQNADFGEGGKLAVPDPGGSGVWHHRFAVGKRLVGDGAGLNDVIRWGGTEPGIATRVWVDDAYVIRLAPVALTFLYDPR